MPRPIETARMGRVADGRGAVRRESSDGGDRSMSHTIRLRGAWECAPADGPTTGVPRLSLPARADSLPAGRLRLRRWFHRPPLDGDATAVLRLSRCPGLCSVVFNGHRLGLGSSGRPEFEVDLGPLEPRNELIIEAEPPRDVDEWGCISLIFGAESSAGPG